MLRVRVNFRERLRPRQAGLARGPLSPEREAEKRCLSRLFAFAELRPRPALGFETTVRVTTKWGNVFHAQRLSCTLRGAATAINEALGYQGYLFSRTRLMKNAKRLLNVGRRSGKYINRRRGVR
jgi:hypothetical protein